MDAATEKTEEQRKWLAEILPHHERLATGVESLLQNMLKKKEIEYLSVKSRVKTIDGAIEKIGRKDYRDPVKQMTDLSGIRIVTFLEEQVLEITEVIKELFEVDKANSLDRSEILGDDKVGYRSTHFVCALGRKRKALPENESLGDLKFEIQVRTVLQHAWAELAHDRSFKFGTALPTKIQRKLNLYSGMLEIVDNAFDEISKEIEKYSETINSKTIKQISNLELNSILLGKFINDLKFPPMITLVDDPNLHPFVLHELKVFGVKSVGDLAKLITPTFLNTYARNPEPRTLSTYQITRVAMLVTDLHKSLAAIAHPVRLSPSVFERLTEKYDIKILDKAVKDGTIEIVGKKIQP